MWPWPSWSEVKKSAESTYNSVKQTAKAAYTSTVTTVRSVSNTVVKDVKAAGVATQKAVKENKETILNVAKTAQDAGDGLVIAGTGAAVVGAGFAGVGAAPGLATIASGEIIGLAGSGLEILTNLITEDYKGAGNEAGFVLAGELIDAAVDRALPGPTPDMSKAATSLLKESNEVVKSLAKAHTVGGSRVVKAVQESKKK